MEFGIICGGLYGRLLQIRRLSDLVISIRARSLASTCTHSVQLLEGITGCVIECDYFETGLVG